MLTLKIFGAIMGIAFCLANIGQSADTVLLTAYQENNPPRYFMQDDQERGICVDLLKALNQKLQGTSLSIDSTGWYPLPRILNMMESDQLQIFIGLIRSPEREQQFQFAKTPLFEFRPIFAKIAGDPFEYTDAASLQGKSVGTERGSEFSRQMQEIPGVRVEEVTAMQQNLLKLLARRIDLVYYHQIGLEWEIKAGGFTGRIALTQNAFDDVRMHYVMLSKNVPQQVIDEIDRALTAMKEDGTIDTILTAYK